MTELKLLENLLVIIRQWVVQSVFFSDIWTVLSRSVMFNQFICIFMMFSDSTFFIKSVAVGSLITESSALIWFPINYSWCILHLDNIFPWFLVKTSHLWYHHFKKRNWKVFLEGRKKEGGREGFWWGENNRENIFTADIFSAVWSQFCN